MKNVAVIGIVSYAYTIIYTLYTVFAPFTLRVDTQLHELEGIVLYVASGFLVLACTYGIYVAYKQFVVGGKQNTLKLVLLNTIIFLLMLIDYVMFKNTHLNAYEEMIYHYGCIISVLILLCITTALVNQNKVIDTKNDVSIMDNMASSDA